MGSAMHRGFSAAIARSFAYQSSCSSGGGCRAGRVSATAAGPAELRPPNITGEHASFRTQVSAASRAVMGAGTGFFSPRSASDVTTPAIALSGRSLLGASSVLSGSATLISVTSAVRTAVQPLLDAQGLDLDSESSDAVKGVPGLAEDIIAAAYAALVGVIGADGGGSLLSRFGGLGPGSSGASPLSGASTRSMRGRAQRAQSRHSPGTGGTSFRAGRFGALQTMSDDPTTSDGQDDPLDRRNGFPLFLPFGPRGPNGPGEADTTCSTTILSETANCTSSEGSDVCSAVSFLEDHFDRVPDFEDGGIPYRTTIAAVAEFASVRCVHSAGDHPRGETPSGFGQSLSETPSEVLVMPAFFDSVMADLIGPDEFRAGVILHELVHLTEFQVEDLGAAFGRLSGGSSSGDDFEDRFSNRNAGCGVSSCPTSDGSDVTTEWRAAFVQAKFYGMDDCGAELFACSYFRTFCTNQTQWDNIWATATDLASCYVGYTSTLVVTIVAAIVVAGSLVGAGLWAELVIALLGGASVSLLLGLLFVILIDETPLG